MVRTRRNLSLCLPLALFPSWKAPPLTSPGFKDELQRFASGSTAGFESRSRVETNETRAEDPHPSTGPAVYLPTEISCISSQLCGIGKYTSGLTFRVPWNISLHDSSVNPIGGGIVPWSLAVNLRGPAFRRRAYFNAAFNYVQLQEKGSAPRSGEGRKKIEEGGRTPLSGCCVVYAVRYMRQRNDRGMKMLRALGDRLTACGQRRF